MEDIASIWADEAIESLERRIRLVYARAAKEARKRAETYIAASARRNAVKLELLKAKKITMQTYTDWLIGQVEISKDFNACADQIAQEYVRSNQIAVSMMNGTAQAVYAQNHNYQAYRISQDAGVHLTFTLYDKKTVERLIAEDGRILPKLKVDIPKDMAWNKKKIKAEVVQGVLLGKPLQEIADGLETVTNMNRASAMRHARTAMTDAQNRGRQAAAEKANAKGIHTKKQWIATLDYRTRHSHAMVDGELVEEDEPFSNGLQYPGDMNGNPRELWGCRCSVAHRPDGIRTTSGRRDNITGEVVQNMTYVAWLKTMGDVK